MQRTVIIEKEKQRYEGKETGNTVYRAYFKESWHDIKGCPQGKSTAGIQFGAMHAARRLLQAVWVESGLMLNINNIIIDDRTGEDFRTVDSCGEYVLYDICNDYSVERAADQQMNLDGYIKRAKTDSLFIVLLDKKYKEAHFVLIRRDRIAPKYLYL